MGKGVTAIQIIPGLRQDGAGQRAWTLEKTANIQIPILPHSSCETLEKLFNLFGLHP